MPRLKNKLHLLFFHRAEGETWGSNQRFVIHNSGYYDGGRAVFGDKGSVQKMGWLLGLWDQSVDVGIIKQEEGRRVLVTKG